MLSWVDNAFTYVEGLISGALTWLWVTIVLPAINALRDAADAAIGVVTSLVADAQSFALVLWNDYIVPATVWIQHAGDLIGGWITSAIATFYNDVLLPIWSFVQSAAQEADTAWHWVEQYGDDVWHVIDAAWGWLVWLGENTYDDVVAAIHDIVHPVTTSFVQQEIQLGQSHIDAIADYFDKVLS